MFLRDTKDSSKTKQIETPIPISNIDDISLYFFLSSLLKMLDS